MIVTRGQVTYDAEGNDEKGSRYYSRIIHWPGNALSGVTIGRGYDMGSRVESSVLNDMRSAGISLEKAKLISKGAKLKGTRAGEFVNKNKVAIGEIENIHQIKLFNSIYKEYEIRGKQNYIRWTANIKNHISWDKLHFSIRDILVDFVYQGFTKGANPMKSGMNNDFDEMIKYIETTPAINRYELGRNRAKYLKKHKITALNKVEIK